MENPTAERGAVEQRQPGAEARGLDLDELKAQEVGLLPDRLELKKKKKKKK